MRAALARVAGPGRRWLRRLGYDIVRHQPGTPFGRLRAQLLADHGVALAIDVGASVGDYALTLREEGFRGRILSLEPLTASFTVLAARTEADVNWNAMQIAAGAQPDELLMNISARTDCSSLLAMDDRHREAAPGSEYIAQQSVRIVPLDSLDVSGQADNSPIFVKLDVQGYELPVLNGASKLLDDVAVLEAELSMVELYEGQALFAEVIGRLREIGLVLVAVEPSFNDPATGEALQFNGLFTRS